MSQAPISFALQKKYFNLCNPSEALAPDDERCVDIDGKRRKARGGSLAARLVKRVQLAGDEPLCELFTGLPGTGKSTELRRVADLLADPDGANLLPILVDAEKTVDLANPIDVPDILASILYYADAALLSLEGKDPDGALKEGRIKRFLRWFSTAEGSVTGGDVSGGVKVPLAPGVPGGPEVNLGGKVIFDLKSNPSLRKLVRQRVTEHMTMFVEEVSEELAAIDARARAKKRAGIIILFDSLEKLRGSSSNFTDVLRSAERIFGSGAPYLKLPVHVVYTIPTALSLRLNIPVFFLPMLKLADREGHRADGFDAALDIVRRRVPDEALNELLGPTNKADRLDRIICSSGGYPREIVRMLRNAIADAPLDKDAFDALLSEAGEATTRIVTRDAYTWLARVHLDKDVSLDTEEHREIADRMLSNNVVLRYQNNSAWYDLHPAVREIAGVKKEIDRLREAEKTPAG